MCESVDEVDIVVPGVCRPPWEDISKELEKLLEPQKMED